MAIKAIVRSMSVNHSQISVKQNNVIDDRIAGIKLSAKELWKHGFHLAERPAYKAVFKEKVSRVCPLSDGIARIYNLSEKNIGAKKCCEEHGDRIYVNNIAVNQPNNDRITFARRVHTDYLVIRDSGDSEVEIFEQETARGNAVPLQNTFEVDLDQQESYSYAYICQHGNVHINLEPVYLIKELSASLIAAHAKEDVKNDY